MKPELFVFLSLVNKNLREGSVLHRRSFGVQTSYWSALESLSPEKLPDGTYRGDAEYFLRLPVQMPLQKFQSALQYYRDGTGCLPLPGESLTDSYIPRLVIAVTKALQERGRLTMDDVELSPSNLQMIAIMDNYQLRSVIIDTFGLGGMPVEMQDDVIRTIGELVIQGLIGRALENMDDEALAEFEKLTADSNDVEAIMTYVESFIPDFDQAVVEEVQRVQAEMAPEELGK